MTPSLGSSCAPIQSEIKMWCDKSNDDTNYKYILYIISNYEKYENKSVHCSCDEWIGLLRLGRLNPIGVIKEILNTFLILYVTFFLCHNFIACQICYIRLT